MKLHFSTPILLSSLLLSFVATPLVAALPDGWFPFPMLWDDHVPDTATDVSFLNHKPAGKNGRVVVKDGHFITDGNGERIRFFGFNIGGSELFGANRSDYVPFARRMAKHGVNVVRLHHIDNPWDITNKRSLWKNQPGPLTIDPERMADLHAFIDACVSEGIYFNLNLKASKELTEADGMPKTVEGFTLKGNHQKGIDLYYEPMIEHQKSIARELLLSRNQAGVRLVDNPALMTVEINNENSLVGFHYSNPAGDLDKIPEPMKADLKEKWNAWLIAKYQNDTTLTKAWKSESDATGKDLITSESKWSSKTNSPGNSVKIDDSDVAVKFTVETETMTDWHSQALLSPLAVAGEVQYTLSFNGRANPPRTMRIAIDAAAGSGVALGVEKKVELGEEPRHYELPFSVRCVGITPASLVLQLGATSGEVDLESMKIIAGVTEKVPPTGMSLAKRNIGFDRMLSPQMSLDWLEFVAGIDRTFAQRMTAFLKNELHVKAPIVDCQVSWGGITGYNREAGSDFIDDHTYWQHPTFGGGDWDPQNWTVGNESYVDDIAKGGRGGLSAMAIVRQAGKPFSISELDHPAPSLYRSEMVPLAAVMGCLQDWDAIYLFAAGAFGTSAFAQEQVNRIDNFFDVGSDPSKFGFCASAALIFRDGLLPPSGRVATLQLSPRPWRFAANQHAHWARLQGDKPESILAARWQVDPNANVTEPKLKDNGKAPESLVGIQTKKAGNVIVGAGESLVVMSGFVGGSEVSTETASVNFAATPNNHISAMIVATDKLPLAESERLLISLVGGAENPGMKWNKERTSVGTGWGEAPVHCAPVSATFKLKRERVSKVYSLGLNGERKGEIEAGFRDGILSFQLTPDLETIWIEVAGD